MSDILDELGIDPEEFEWQDLALCQGMPTTLFYETYESDKQAAMATDQVCLHCPVRKQCLLSGAEGEHGVWGGVYWNGAGRPDASKNSHKSEEEWAEIYRSLS